MTKVNKCKRCRHPKHTNIVMKIGNKILLHLPFSYLWILKRTIGGPKNMLDLGCGDGLLMVLLRLEAEITGVEIDMKSVTEAVKTGMYKKVYRQSVTELSPTIKNHKWEVVLCSQVVEHLKKKVAVREIRNWENLATDKLIITTINGLFEYERIESQDKESTPHDKHISAWSVRDFKNMGFKVHGQGIYFIYGKNGLVRKYPRFYLLCQVIGYLFSPIAYFYPEKAAYLINFKKV